MLGQLGHEVRVFAGRLGPSRHRYRVTEHTGPIHTTWIGIERQDLGGPAQPLVNRDVGRRLGRVLDDFQPDVVHFHNITALSITVIAACRRRRIPCVMTLHDYWGICFKNLMIKNDGALCATGGFACLGCSETLAGIPSLPSPVRNAHILLALRDIDRFIAPSRYLADRFVANGLPADRMHVVRNGIDLGRYVERHRREAGAPFTIGYIGQLIEHKGVDVLLRALGVLGDDTRLVVVGDGVQAGRLERLCRDLGIERRVRFAGRVDNRDIAKIHADIDVVAVPSVWPENSPVVITEAMASAIPVVASDIGGISELVVDGETGWLVPPRDARVLAERIDWLRRHPDERRRMGDRAAERIRTHELRQQVRRIVEIFEEVVASRVRGDVRAVDAEDVVLYHDAHDWDVALRDAIYRIAGVDGARAERALLCRVDLAAPETLDRATMLVIPSANADSFRYACEALGRGVPIVVHEAARDLKALCLASNAGLFYAGDELTACVELLLSDRELRAALGANGRTFYAASAS